jgi:hypothetical protein
MNTFVMEGEAKEYGSEVRLAEPFLYDYLADIASLGSEKATGWREKVMKTAVFVCTGSWPKEVRLK